MSSPIANQWGDKPNPGYCVFEETFKALGSGLRIIVHDPYPAVAFLKGSLKAAVETTCAAGVSWKPLIDNTISVLRRYHIVGSVGRSVVDDVDRQEAGSGQEEHRCTGTGVPCGCR